MKGKEFKEYCAAHEQGMLSEIVLVKQKKLLPADEAMGCYEVADRYWCVLQQDMLAYEFTDLTEEIEFFKILKPKFTSEIEYYKLLFHVHQFCPEELANERARFLGHELKRISQFFNENMYFYHYYGSSAIMWDMIYFTRGREGIGNAICLHAYQTPLRVSSSHDHLVASILAVSRYKAWVEQQLEMLTPVLP